MKNIQNEVITYDNVQELGEMIAIKALKTTASHSGGKLDYLYKGLGQNKRATHIAILS